MALVYTWFKVLFGVVVWVCDRVFQKSGWLQVSSPTSWCALCLNVCQQHATCSCAEVGVVGFLCIHLVVVSEREISAFVMCVGVFCITMTKSGAGPNGCVSNLQVRVKRVTHVCAVNAYFTHTVARFCLGKHVCCKCVWCFEARCVHSFCPHCAMGQIVLQNTRRAVLTEAVRCVAMVI